MIQTLPIQDYILVRNYLLYELLQCDLHNTPPFVFIFFGRGLFVVESVIKETYSSI